MSKSLEKQKLYRRILHELAKEGIGFGADGKKKELQPSVNRADRELMASYQVGPFTRRRAR